MTLEERGAMRTALEASIDKWEKNIERVKKGSSPRLGALDCPLCQLYYVNCQHAVETDCLFCPVHKTTGVRHCHNSPYVWVADEGRWWDALRCAPYKVARLSKAHDRRQTLFCTCEHEFLTLIEQGETEKAMEVVEWLYNYWDTVLEEDYAD